MQTACQFGLELESTKIREIWSPGQLRPVSWDIGMKYGISRKIREIWQPRLQSLQSQVDRGEFQYIELFGKVKNHICNLNCSGHLLLQNSLPVTKMMKPILANIFSHFFLEICRWQRVTDRMHVWDKIALYFQSIGLKFCLKDLRFNGIDFWIWFLELFLSLWV